MSKKYHLLFVACVSLFYFSFAFSTIKIVAAENVYGSVIEQLGGSYVEVKSILKNPAQDPHLFNLTSSTAKDIETADIIVYNGAGYDPWMNQLLGSIDTSKKQVIEIAALMQTFSGANPHLWYLPDTIPTFAAKITTILSHQDTAHQKYFTDQLTLFLKQYQEIYKALHDIRQRYKNTVVTATEPVFNYMVSAAGLKMEGEDFQNKMMNDIPPSISEIQTFENNLRQHRVRVLIYNYQVSNKLTQQMLKLAQEEQIPSLGVSEVLPPNENYIPWVLDELNSLKQALSGKSTE